MTSKLKKIWKFIWEEDSLLSWIVNIILAFLIVKFLLYPGFGLLLRTDYPVVAVVSNSMDHEGHNFNGWWDKKGDWYINNDITKEKFSKYSFKNGFNKGDIMILKGKNIKDINLGDVVVFIGNSKDPIIHRVVLKWEENNEYFIKTKGDKNSDSAPNLGETKISNDRLIGKAYLRVPLLGWIKIIAVSLKDSFIMLITNR